ncbi:hypothetical protein [Butyrivibrio sp. MC2021]|uniref:hypothetical protein n=1 Tax=Butyrivibrio sp. MC2021 TaxID=1408306 RepID=UPI00047939C5|nr:hypothetical protein [Butyrivibrio sp. MC2021]
MLGFGDMEIVRAEGDLRLLKIGCRGNREVYCVLGDGPTKHYEDYEDALDDFNLRWMKSIYGD